MEKKQLPEALDPNDHYIRMAKHNILMTEHFEKGISYIKKYNRAILIDKCFSSLVSGVFVSGVIISAVSNTNPLLALLGFIPAFLVFKLDPRKSINPYIFKMLPESTQKEIKDSFKARILNREFNENIVAFADKYFCSHSPELLTPLTKSMKEGKILDIVNPKSEVYKAIKALGYTNPKV